MSLEENALGDAGIFQPLFDDVEGVVFEVVVDDALPNSEVLIGVLNHRLLEVGVELEDLFKNKVKRNII